MKHIAPLMPELTRLYPTIDLQIIAVNRYFDLIDSGIHVAIRTREFESDSSLTVRSRAEARRIRGALQPGNF